MNTEYVLIVVKENVVKFYGWKSKNHYHNGGTPTVECYHFVDEVNPIETIIGKYILEFNPTDPHIVYYL